MVEGYLDGFEYPFAYGDGWDDDDELPEPVLFVELEDGPKIDIRFTGARSPFRW